MNCRSCDHNLVPIFSLGDMPLANRLCDYPGEPVAHYALDLMYCQHCSLGQLRDLVPPNKMFMDYTYFTSVNGPMVKAAEGLASEVAKQYLKTPSPDEQQLVVEIGSNDGYLLQFYKAMNWPVLGIDPAHGPSVVAQKKGIKVREEFFTHALAETLPKATVIHAHNVLAHVPDLRDFLGGVQEMLQPDGVFIIEVPDAALMIEYALFDLIYHEHVYYFTLESLSVLLCSAGLAIVDCQRIPSHGGSLRLFVQHASGFHEIPTSDLDVKGFGRKASRISFRLHSFLEQLKKDGKRVWGFGAAAKATIMMNYVNLNSTHIYAIADSTPAKIGNYIAGTGVKVIHPDAWLKAQPDYTCIFAWNYADEIRARYAKDYKGVFFTPYSLPDEVHS